MSCTIFIIDFYMYYLTSSNVKYIVSQWNIG